jgi:hypothetical protein
MKVFLDEYLDERKDWDDKTFSDQTALLIQSLDIFFEVLGERAFRPEKAINAAVFDAMMVGCARRLRTGKIAHLSALGTAYDMLLKDESFQRFYQRATADEESVKSRIRLATEAFAGLV